MVAVGDKGVVLSAKDGSISMLLQDLPEDCAYFEQDVALLNNKLLTISTVPADKDFIPPDTLGADGLISTDNAKVQRILLVVMGTAANSFDGANALDCPVAAYNEWQAVLDDGDYFDLEPNGQMHTNDWPIEAKGAPHTFAFVFNVTDQIIPNVDGNIGLTIRNGCSKQDSLKVTVTAFLKVLWKL